MSLTPKLTQPLPLLGGLSPRDFMQQHWQKALRLMPGAVPGFADLLDTKAMFALATSQDVESRLVIRDGKRWILEHGPFKKTRFASLPARDWTLLVQGLNLHVPAADSLLRQFSFLPYARLDDVMVSLAAPGGGVGPHFDSYDVFLLQGIGKRRWKLSTQSDLSLDPEAPLKILKKMSTEQTVDVTAGDLLYLPPHVAHDGVAMQEEGFCTTYSVGFRAPTHQEIADGFLDWLGATSEIEGRLSDPDLPATANPARVPKQYQRQIADAIAALQIDRDVLLDLLRSDVRVAMTAAELLALQRVVARAAGEHGRSTPAAGTRRERRERNLFTAHDGVRCTNGLLDQRCTGRSIRSCDV